MHCCSQCSAHPDFLQSQQECHSSLLPHGRQNSPEPKSGQPRVRTTYRNSDTRYSDTRYSETRFSDTPYSDRPIVPLPRLVKVIVDLDRDYFSTPRARRESEEPQDFFSPPSSHFPLCSLCPVWAPGRPVARGSQGGPCPPLNPSVPPARAKNINLSYCKKVNFRANVLNFACVSQQL